MPSRYSRREFVKRTAAGVSAAAALSALPGDLLAAAKSPFHVGVINDEIGQDFGRVLEIITKDFGLEWVELRGMWSKNILKLDDKEIAEAQKLRQPLSPKSGEEALHVLEEIYAAPDEVVQAARAIVSQ